MSNSQIDVRTAGALVLNQLGVFRDRYGQEALDAALGRLPDALQKELRELDVHDWVSVEHTACMHQAFAEELNRDLAVLHAELTNGGLVRTMERLWPNAGLVGASDAYLVSLGRTVFAQSYNRATWESTLLGPGHATAEVHGWPHMPELQINAVANASKALLKLAGRQMRQSDHRRVADGVLFEFRWNVVKKPV